MKLTDNSTTHFTALGLTSLQEFLVLHYYATDSAASWHRLLQELFPHVLWTLPGQIRHKVKQLFRTVHIAPSHRRAPHPCWTGPMHLLLCLMLGHGRMRLISYLEAPLPRTVYVQVRGFSAGSFVGLTALHLLWQLKATSARGALGAIACPPKLLELVTRQLAERLLLVHYHGDLLCMWRNRTVYVTGDWKYHRKPLLT